MLGTPNGSMYALMPPGTMPQPYIKQVCMLKLPCLSIATTASLPNVRMAESPVRYSPTGNVPGGVLAF